MAQEQKYQKTMEKYGLGDMQDAIDRKSVHDIFAELAGTGLMEIGVRLGGGNARDIEKTQMFYQRAIVEQNWIIIRQLDRISKLLEKEVKMSNAQAVTATIREFEEMKNEGLFTEEQFNWKKRQLLDSI